MDGPYWRSRFLTEARIMARFEHPHIVAVKELSALADGTPFFVMPFIEANLIDEMGTDAADPGVIAGLAAGCLVTIAWNLVPAWQWQLVHPGVWGLGANVIVLVAGSLATEPMDPAHVETFVP